MNLSLLKYIKSFCDGRVRIRHPALHNQTVASTAVAKMRAVHGIDTVENNTLSGSILILYDCTVLGKDDLIPMGEAWAAYFNAVLAGENATPPEFA